MLTLCMAFRCMRPSRAAWTHVQHAEHLPVRRTSLGTSLVPEHLWFTAPLPHRRAESADFLLPGALPAAVPTSSAPASIPLEWSISLVADLDLPVVLLPKRVAHATEKPPPHARYLQTVLALDLGQLSLRSGQPTPRTTCRHSAAQACPPPAPIASAPPPPDAVAPPANAAPSAPPVSCAPAAADAPTRHVTFGDVPVGESNAAHATRSRDAPRAHATKDGLPDDGGPNRERTAAPGSAAAVGMYDDTFLEAGALRHAHVVATWRHVHFELLNWPPRTGAKDACIPVLRLDLTVSASLRLAADGAFSVREVAISSREIHLGLTEPLVRYMTTPEVPPSYGSQDGKGQAAGAERLAMASVAEQSVSWSAQKSSPFSNRRPQATTKSGGSALMPGAMPQSRQPAKAVGRRLPGGHRGGALARDKTIGGFVGGLTARVIDEAAHAADTVKRTLHLTGGQKPSWIKVRDRWSNRKSRSSSILDEGA